MRKAKSSPRARKAPARLLKPSPPEARPSGSYHHGNLRSALIEAGIFLLHTEGLEAMSLRGAARLAGVSRAAPKNHFSDKKALLAAIAAHGFGLLTRVRLTLLERARGAEARVRAMITGYVKFAVEEPALFHLMFGPIIHDKSQYPDLDEAAKSSYQFLTDVLREFEAETNPSPSKDPGTFVVWSAAHGLATLVTSGIDSPFRDFRRDYAELSEELCDFIVQGLQARRVDTGKRRKAS